MNNRKNIILDTLGSIGAFFIGVSLFIMFVGWCGYYFFDACKYDLIHIMGLGSQWILITLLSLLTVSGIIYIYFNVWKYWIKPFVDLMICRWRKVESKKVAELEEGIYKNALYTIPLTPLTATQPCCQKCALSDFFGLKTCQNTEKQCGALNGYKEFILSPNGLPSEDTWKAILKQDVKEATKPKVGKPISRKTAIKVAKNIQRKAERKRKV